MSDLTPERLCSQSISDHTGFHFFPCHKPAKFAVLHEDGRVFYRCGIHVKRARRHMENGHSVRSVNPL